MKSVYLAGPIVGLTWEEAAGWRIRAAHEFACVGATALNPLRGKKVWEGPWKTSMYDVGADGMPSSDLVKRDLSDIDRADVVLCNLVGVTPDRAPVGSLIEIGFAHGLGKPVVLVCNTDLGHHPFLKVVPEFTTPYLSTAIARVRHLLLKKGELNGTE